MTRILLVDDHQIVRAGIRLLLEKIPDLEVVQEAANGTEAIRLCGLLNPHIVIMDIAMLEMNGIDATIRIVKEFPAIKIIMLSMYGTEEYILQALNAGASGYLVKNSLSDELGKAIQTVISGGIYLTPALSRQISKYVRQQGKSESTGRLSVRQREVLRLIAEGYCTKEIAARLEISVKTVETHRLQLMARLQIHDIPNLVRYAIRSGLVDC